jgi:hypothetical protein
LSEIGGSTYLFIRETLAAEGDALLSQDGGDARLGDAIVSADLLGRFAVVAPDDIRDIGGG